MANSTKSGIKVLIGMESASYDICDNHNKRLIVL